jgi:16S rRNA (uracil1498-N3)-methyltransferase
MKSSNIAPRFFIEEDLNQEEILLKDKNIIHQIQKVLRKKVGDEIILLDGKGIEFFGEIKEISKKEILISKIKNNFYESEGVVKNKKQKIILAPSILKKDNFELVIQKCTEIGINNFQPIISERTEKNNLNFERLEKISREASEQSEKIFLPKILETKTIEEFLSEEKEKGDKIFALQFGSPKISKEEIENISEGIIFLVGPEGGWGESDLELFEKFNVQKISLGQQILRAETASISLSSILLLGN